MQPLYPRRDAPSSFNIAVVPYMEEGGMMLTVKKIWFKELGSHRVDTTEVT